MLKLIKRLRDIEKRNINIRQANYIISVLVRLLRYNTNTVRLENIRSNKMRWDSGISRGLRTESDKPFLALKKIKKRLSRD